MDIEERMREALETYLACDSSDLSDVEACYECPLFCRDPNEMSMCNHFSGVKQALEESTDTVPLVPV